jgi:hypothetical protein
MATERFTKTVPTPVAMSGERLGKNQFKCFSCRLVYQFKDGDWYSWDRMEVHLCHPCAKKTENKAERRSSK